MNENGAVFYRGPSLLTGEPIVAVATGFAYRTGNTKTGAMLQTWILRADRRPMDAARANVDDAVCGSCPLRGDAGYGRRCYVPLWLGPLNVYKQLDAYEAAPWSRVRELLRGRHVRLGAYGDPAALPFEVWRVVLETAAGWTGYTHQWATCDPRFQAIAMASVDSPSEQEEARARGWRTYRVRTRTQAPLLDEVVCPASAEGDHRATCETCELCRGLATRGRHVTIIAHGNPGTVAHFYRGTHAQP